MRARSLEEADAALAQWRARLAAASRNVVELSELPAFLALKARPATGRTAEATRGLIATMDELWQGVLLIGGAIDRAAAARATGSRLWRGEEAATDALAILEGESIEITTADLPVLNRGLLASARPAIRVTPQRLLEAMEHAFERAKVSVDSLAQARERCMAARAELDAMLASLAAGGWAGEAEARAGLDAAQAETDPLGAIERIAALRPPLAAATQARAAAGRELEAARSELAVLASLRQRLDAALTACRAATDADPEIPDPAEAAELAGWLDRLTRTLGSGRIDAFGVGLARWRDLAGKVRGDCERALVVATAALSRRDELRGRFGALRAKQAARKGSPGATDASAEAAARELHDMLFGHAIKLKEAEVLMRRYEAALAGAAPVGVGAQGAKPC
jgi:hypothetical protein